jgi:hypothetical protein
LAEFSASPAHFVQTQGLAHNFVDGVSAAIWIQTTKQAIYPMLVDIPLLGSILEYCLASLIYNRAIVESWDAMHVVQRTSTLFCVAGLGLAQASPFVKIVYHGVLVLQISHSVESHHMLPSYMKFNLSVANKMGLLRTFVLH